jgi:alpha-galactosidase
MRTGFLLAIAVLLALLPIGLHLGATTNDFQIPLSTQQGVGAIITLGLEERLDQVAVQQAGTTTTYSDGNYNVQVTETAAKSHSIIRVEVTKVSGEAFPVDNFSIAFRVPGKSIQGIWYPGANASSTNVMVTDATQAINDVSDANFGIPYLAAAGANSKNVFALGLGRQNLGMSISGQPVDGGFYEFRLKGLRRQTTTAFDERFYVSTDPSMTWFDTASHYADWVDALNKYIPFPIGDRAYEPLYDAWYWTQDRVNDQVYRDTARLASELGIGLYLADSGWDTDAGEYQKWLGGKTGDYNPPADKFSNLEQTFNEMRSQDGVGIDLWLQPFAVGRESVRYDATRTMHIQLPMQVSPGMGWPGQSYNPFALPLGNNLEDVNLCPRMASTATYLQNLFTDVATKYHPDGYWLDFIDGMPSFCVAPHRHSEAVFGNGFNRSLQTIKDTVLSFNPQAIVHFRERYANLNTKSYASVWQSGDAPGDFDQMRLNSIRLHPFGKGVVFASDQMYWPEGTSEPQVAKFIMTSVMVGVPAFGATLVYSPPSTLAMMKAWIHFYREHKSDIATGRFSPFGELKMPNHKIEGQDRTYAYLRNLNFSQLTAEGHEVFLMNATDGDHIRATVRVPAGSSAYSVTILNRFLDPEPARIKAPVGLNNVLSLNLTIEQGGMAILTPLQAANGNAGSRRPF